MVPPSVLLALRFKWASIVNVDALAGFGNFSGIISSFSFRSPEAPHYLSGYGLLIGTLSMSTICSVIMHIYLVRENARRDTEMEAQGLSLDTYTDKMKHHEREKGDNASVCLA